MDQTPSAPAKFRRAAAATLTGKEPEKVLLRTVSAWQATSASKLKRIAQTLTKEAMVAALDHESDERVDRATAQSYLSARIGTIVSRDYSLKRKDKSKPWSFATLSRRIHSIMNEQSSLWKAVNPMRPGKAVALLNAQNSKSTYSAVSMRETLMELESKSSPKCVYMTLSLD